MSQSNKNTQHDNKISLRLGRSLIVLTYLKRLFGLEVGAMKQVDDDDSCSVFVKKYSVPWFVYSLLLNSLHLTYFVRNMSFTKSVKVSVLDFGLDVMFTLAGGVCMFVTLTWSVWNTYRHFKLKSSMERFDERFAMLGATVDNRRLRAFTIYEVTIVLAFWTFYFSYYVFWNCDTDNVTCLKNLFVTYHPHKVLMVAFLEEIALVHGLSQRFRQLNEVIEQTTSQVEIIVVETKRARPNVRGTRMVHCRELHYFLCDICADLNSIYSLQTVANILDCFVNIFVSLYLVCFGYSRDVENSGVNMNPLGIFLPLCLGAEASTKIFYLAKYCEAVQYEAKQTGELIHKISMYSLNEEFRNEVLQFSQQLVHKNVKITACGMFPIDYSLIYNIVSAVTTFIVILIQFALAINYNAPLPTVDLSIDKQDNSINEHIQLTR